MSFLQLLDAIWKKDDFKNLKADLRLYFLSRLKLISLNCPYILYFTVKNTYNRYYMRNNNFQFFYFKSLFLIIEM